MKKNKSILILGAGNAQIDFIHSCKSYGMETYGCSYSNHDPGIPLLEHFEQINIIDKEAICHYVLKNNIDQIYTVGSDISIPTISYVIEKCNMNPIFSLNSAEICCSKKAIRKTMEGSRYSVPYMTLKSLEELKKKDMDHFSYPLMIKPVDSQGQRGVRRIDCTEELLEQFPDSLAYSRSKEVILESFMDGEEVSVNLYMKDGEMRFFLISDRESYEEFPGGIIKAHHIPSVFEGTEIADKIKEFVLYFVDKIGYKDGPMYFQIMVSDDNPYLIECAPRLDGCHLWRLIEMYCGVNLLDTVTSAILDDNETFEKSLIIHPEKIRPLSLRFLCQPPNIEFYKENVQDCSEGEVLYEQFYYQEGEVVKPVNRYMEKCGYQIYIP